MTLSIDQFSRVCDIVPQVGESLAWRWDETFRKQRIATKQLSWVYLIVIDGEVHKIGKTDNSLGISNLVIGYCKGVFKDRERHRVTMEEALAAGKTVQFYGCWREPQRVKILMYDGTEVETAVRVGRDMEKYALDRYFETYGCYPPGNDHEVNCASRRGGTRNEQEAAG